MSNPGWARRLATGLSSFGSSLLRSLAASRFNPSREEATMPDEYVRIPPEFFEPFTREPVERRELGPLEWVCLLEDGTQTYSNWETGTLAVRHPDGQTESYEGMMLNRREVERWVDKLRAK